MEDFVRKTLEVRDINALPLNTSKELDMVADSNGRIFIKIKNNFKEMLFDDYKDTIKQILTNIENLNKYDTELTEQINEIKQQLPIIKQNKEDIKNLTNNLNELSNRLTPIENQQTGISIKISDLEKSFSSLGDIELLKHSIEQNTKDNETNNKKMTDLNTQLTTEINTRKSNIADLTSRVDKLDTKIQTTITTQDSINATHNTRLNTLESKVVDGAWTNVTPLGSFTMPKQIQVKKQNGVVYFRGTLSDGTGDCFTIPEGFRPPAEGGYEFHFLLPGQSNTQSDVGKIYVRPSGVCSIASKSGTTPLFVDTIHYSLT